MGNKEMEETFQCTDDNLGSRPIVAHIVLEKTTGRGKSEAVDSFLSEKRPSAVVLDAIMSTFYISY